MENDNKHILLTGGGTLGPVTPLIVVGEAWREMDLDVQLSWMGTPHGPEREIVERSGMDFSSLYAPKLDRHKKWFWIFVPFLLFYSCVKAFFELRRLQPDIVFTAGGYVSVPVVWMAFLQRIPIWVHQLDVVPGVANRMMAPFAKRVSVTFPATMSAFSSSKVRHVGSLVRREILEGSSARFFQQYNFDEKPLLFVMGGGTGAQQINDAMDVIAEDLLPYMNILHVTGKGKMSDSLKRKGDGYVAIEFMGNEIADAYAAADLMVVRAGIGTLLELSAMRKATIIVPMPNSHQEKNAAAVDEKEAAKVLFKMNPQILKQEIMRLMRYPEARTQLEIQMGSLFEGDGAVEIVREAQTILQK